MKKIFFIVCLFLTACTSGAPTISVSGVPTVDPYVMAAQAQRTAAAAQDEAEFYGTQLTATAQAPIIQITQTAAEWTMQQQYGAATQQSVQMTETAAITATAQSWTPTPNATMTAVFANSAAEATKIANDVEINNLQVERARTTNTMRAMSGYVIGFLMLIAGVMFAIVLARKLAVNSNPVDERGNPLPMFDVVDGTAWDIDRSANGMISTRASFLKQLPVVTAERQDTVTSHDQMIDLRARAARLPKALVEAQSTKFLPEPTMTNQLSTDALFSLPDWNVMNNWDGKNGLPYGLSARGLELMDLNQYPHIATIGKTGAGKSRRFLRPFLAGALAAGQRVVIIGKQADYWPFAQHPNATILPVRELTVTDEAKRYAYFLKKIVEEMNRRDGELTSMHRSTWQQAGRENTLIVLDELGNAIDLMPREFAQDSYRYVRGLVKEGRKVGLNIIFSSQRAVGFRDIMTQVGRAVFFVEDEQESRHALGILGAESLQEGYFFAKFGRTNLTGGFAPSDQQIVEFLSGRQVKTLEKQNFIDGDYKPVEETKRQSVMINVDEARMLADDQMKIEDMVNAGKSVSAIVREVYGVTGGGAYVSLANKVKKIAENITSSSYKTPQNGLEMA